MRIISGICRGRQLTPLNGLNIRPTSDRIREALFNILAPRVRHAQILDLFAGTGALGLEALSRGAGHAVFVDRSDTACQIIRQNIHRCGFQDHATVIRQDLFSPWIDAGIACRRFDLIFLDPPYDNGYVLKTIDQKTLSALLSENGIIVAEHAASDPLTSSLNGLDIFRQKKYSRTTISFLTRTQDTV